MKKLIMKKAHEIKSMLERYCRCFGISVDELAPFLDFIDLFDGPALFNRKNPAGHITASAIIFDPNDGSVLLLHHKSLNRWLQPGGHIDVSDKSILDAALREVEEETSITPSEIKIKRHVDGNLLFNLNSHLIHANLFKDEGEHYHHDMMFLFELLTPRRSVSIDRGESLSFKWFSLVEASAYCHISNIANRISMFTDNYES